MRDLIANILIVVADWDRTGCSSLWAGCVIMTFILCSDYCKTSLGIFNLTFIHQSSAAPTLVTQMTKRFFLVLFENVGKRSLTQAPAILGR